jgi:peptidoglycan-associated lipoprotein
MTRHLNSSLTVLVCLTLFATISIGCKKDAEEPVPEETAGSEIPEPEPEVAVEPVEQPCVVETVYFAFDSAELDSSSRTALQEAVECFRGQGSGGSLLLSGAADPRGTEEYNIALGERRAQAVRSYLTSLGLDGNSISTTSVGEEMATGTDEAGWARDRNVSGSEN